MVNTRDLVVADSCLSPTLGCSYLSDCGLHLLRGWLGERLLSHQFPYPFPDTPLTPMFWGLVGQANWSHLWPSHPLSALGVQDLPQWHLQSVEEWTEPSGRHHTPGLWPHDVAAREPQLHLQGPRSGRWEAGQGGEAGDTPTWALTPWAILGLADASAVVMEIDHDRRVVYTETLALAGQDRELLLAAAQPTEEQVLSRLTAPVVTTQLDTKNISFER